MAAPTFSYAQAAKGMSAPVTSTASSKPTSGSATPAKDATSTPSHMHIASVKSWADDAEADLQSENAANQPQGSTSISKAELPSRQEPTSSISSPELGALSSSTVTKDDDVSSLPNASSESTWENKSQASTSVDQSSEPAEKTSEKTKKSKNGERKEPKPLQEAPVPSVNVWSIRAQEQAKARPAVAPAASTTPSVPQGPAAAGPKKTKMETATKGDDKAGQSRKDARTDTDAKRGSKGRSYEKDVKSAPSVLPLPPDRDQESWPTPETAIDEDRKKAQEKGEKIEKERKEGASVGTHGKQEWVKVPYTPSVIFNTPLPNAASTRRGGRGGGRGGAPGSGRATTYGPNGAGHAEKDDSASAALPNGEQTKRGRPEAATPQDASLRSKRTESAPSPIVKEKVPVSTGEKSSKGTEAEAPSKRNSVMGEVPQSGTFPRQYSNKPNKGRRGELPNAGERRRDGDAVPLKDRRISAAAQTDAGPEDTERRAPGFQDAPNGHKQGPNGRRYGPFANSRDHGRGGGARGARAGYTNGHQFTNGHAGPAQASNSFPVGPRSPTTFTPENSAYFSAPQGKYGRNAQRSQSVAADPYRYSPYHTGPPVPHIQTFMGNVYDYNMMQPMSAVPFSPYGVDHHTLFSMLNTQLEYYFSVENLIKDMYLRKHMDSQGFVSLHFIAGFNRIKQLTTDLELIKLVCYQSPVIDYQVGRDGQDRLRPIKKWEQWVLTLGERDASAQNDGPEELHMPPMPHPHGYDQSAQPPYPSMHAGSPTGPVAFGHEGPYPPMNGFHPGAPQDASLGSAEAGPNGTMAEGLNGSAVPHEQMTENATKA